MSEFFTWKFGLWSTLPISLNCCSIFFFTICIFLILAGVVGEYHSLFQVVHIVSWHLKIEQALLVKNLISFK